MATWTDLVGYVKSNYKISDERDGMIKMVFETENLRTQLVFLWLQTLNGGTEEWVQIESPFAELGTVDVTKVLEEIENTVCGGLALASGHLTFRHTIPLESLQISEFERPLILVTSTADAIEQKLVGGDRY